ncbi:MAG: zinc-binding dehydrogenase [Caldilineaceae bacterium]|nr:zinc-binding dehydrogenase [Caldilineaceae bacterium]
MPTTGRAVTVLGQEFQIREFAVPDPAPGTLLLRQELGGICGTDLHNWQKSIATETLMGHEAVGIVAGLGKGVTEDFLGNPLKEGDRVVYHPRNSGVAYGFRGADQPFSGGFGEYIYMTDPQNCWVKFDGPAKVGVLAEPFAVATHSVMRSKMEIGDTVIVQGSGAIGLLTAAAARASGAGKVIVIGGPPERLELAKRLGADVTVDIGEYGDVKERQKIVLAETRKNEGADVVFECAGFLPAFPEGLEYVKTDGTFVEVGHFVDIGTIAVNPNLHFLRRNLRLEGIWGSRYNHFVRGLTILERNEYPFSDLVSHVLPLEGVADGFDALNGTYQLDGETVVKIAVRGAK